MHGSCFYCAWINGVVLLTKNLSSASVNIRVCTAHLSFLQMMAFLVLDCRCELRLESAPVQNRLRSVANCTEGCVFLIVSIFSSNKKVFSRPHAASARLG